MKKQRIIFVFALVLIMGALAFVYYPVSEDYVLTKSAQEPSNNKKITPSASSEAQVPVVAEDDQNPFVQKLLQEYEAYIQQSVEKGLTPGLAVAILRDSAIVYLKGFGLRTMGTTDSIDTHTIFRVGSVSKSITASLAAKLVDEHFFHWDDSITKFLPNFRLKSEEYTHQLTIRHVLSHTIGLPYHAYTSMIEERTPLDTLLNHLQDLDLNAPPGKIYSYQNVGFSLIQKVVETSGKTFEELLQEKLFQPLHMYNASASFMGIMSHTNVASPHHFTKIGWRQTFISDTYYNSVPAGGINCSIADLAMWLKYLNSTRSTFWSDTVREELFTPQVKAISRNRSFWIWQRPRQSYYGLGWRVIQFPKDTLYYHGGYVNGFRSEVAIHPSSKFAIAVLTNAAGNIADQSIPQFYKLHSAYADSIAYWENNVRNTVARKQ